MNFLCLSRIFSGFIHNVCTPPLLMPQGHQPKGTGLLLVLIAVLIAVVLIAVVLIAILVVVLIVALILRAVLILIVHGSLPPSLFGLPR